MLNAIVNTMNVAQFLACVLCLLGAWRSHKDYARDFSTFEKYASLGVGAMAVLAIVNCFI